MWPSKSTKSNDKWFMVNVIAFYYESLTTVHIRQTEHSNVFKKREWKKQTSYAIGGMYERLRFTRSRQKQYDSLIKLRRKCSHGCVFILNATFAYFFHLFSFIFLARLSFICHLFFAVEQVNHITKCMQFISGAILYYFMGKKILHKNSCKQKRVML